MSEQPSNRRDFITGRSTGHLIQGAVDHVADNLAKIADTFTHEASQSSEPAYVLTLSRRAMACDFEIRMNADRAGDDRHSAAAMKALDLIEELEDQMTVYRDQSELVDINNQAADDWVTVEPELFALLQMADQLHHETGGAFDITGGPLSRAWGFDVRRGRMPSEQQLADAREVVGWQYVELDPEQRRVRFLRRGVELNLNSIGKGYAVDRAAGVLAEHGVRSFLFHGGRSTLLARGRRTGQPGWTSRIRHPIRPQQVVAEFTLEDQAMSTSGSATQSFVIGGRRYGHLIDPRTGWPADTMHSVSVLAPTGALADALSTAFYVMGEQATADFCATHPEVQALLVLQGDNPSEIRVRTFNIAECAE